MPDQEAIPDPAQQQPAKRRAGRPAKAILAVAPITQAALELIRRDGYKGLTMAALAKRLNVAPSALYNHVRSKQDVLALVQDHLMSFVDVSAFAEAAWPEAVRAWARSYRDVFAQHTPLIPIIAVQPIADSPQTLRSYEAVAGGFRRAGWPESEIVDAIVALESFIYGSAFDVNAPEDIFDGGGQPAAPGLTGAVQAREARHGRYTADRAFALGLDAIVDGLLARRGDT
ncbi:MAG: TetR/AcrR family transcriptional regulator C-terminal domain-containing protein [Renibacterium sp.]|nr:TetR/AcrR family transcriptional regulator C-terminal domain-containing protein [Renibacterium sp.]